MQSQTKVKGFTLIELLITMSLMALLITLVGPLALDSVEKTNAKSEVIELKSWLRQQSNKIFLSGCDATFDFVGADIIVTSQCAARDTKHFQHLMFNDKSIVFNHNGIPNTQSLEFKRNRNPLKIDLYQLLGFRFEQ